VVVHKNVGKIKTLKMGFCFKAFINVSHNYWDEISWVRTTWWLQPKENVDAPMAADGHSRLAAAIYWKNTGHVT